MKNKNISIGPKKLYRSSYT